MSGSGQRPRLGPFEIGELIGTGGFASVYRAYDQRLNCDVAIKILAENHAMNPDIRERFIREAQALRLVDSPSVISLYDIGETPDGRPYLVMEFADRGGLMERRRQAINDGWQPDNDDVRHLAGALADALAPIHAEQLIHRDVTPANVLIRSVVRSDEVDVGSLIAPDERLMLSDLGLVKDLLASSGLTAGSGTAGFAAPEQQLPLTTLDARSDIYSASAVILWFIVGQSPRTIEDIDRSLGDVGWPMPFVDALVRGLSDQPDARHGTIEEWKADLLSAIPPGEAGATTSASVRGRSGRRRRRLTGRRGRGLGYAAAGLLAVAAAGIAALVFWPEDPIEVSSEEASPTPNLQHFFFASEDDRTILTIIWGASLVPPNVVASEISVSVDGGEWIVEERAEQHSARGWQLYSTATSSADRRPVTLDSDYAARVRWVLDDGTVTGWSQQLSAAIFD